MGGSATPRDPGGTQGIQREDPIWENKPLRSPPHPRIPATQRICQNHRQSQRISKNPAPPPRIWQNPRPPKELLGSQWGGPRVPSHGIAWAPKGSPPMGGPGPPPMGSLGLPRVPSPMGPLPWDPFGLPRVPSHGIPPHLPLNFCPAGQNINYKRINQRLFSEVSC